MAKRRELKKALHEVAAELMIECIAAKHSKNLRQDDVENIARSILLLQDDYNARLSHVDKHQVKRFFNQWHDDLAVSTNEIIDAIYHLH
ncbi:MAG: hypothetical protein IJS59_03335 [Bacteroidaceae bacterium]|nr:hypothetical protein [Bacteroidaceae bacterium]